MKIEHAPASWIKAGVRADYHSVIGGPVTISGVKVTCDPYVLGGHSWVVFIEGKAGCVSVQALSLYQDEVRVSQEFIEAARELLSKAKWLFREAESALDFEHNQDVLIDTQAAITRAEKAFGVK